MQKPGFYWDILLCIKEAVQLARCVFRLTNLNSKSKSCACSVLPKAVSRPALHFQMDATKSHSTAVPLCLSLWTGGMPVARATWKVVLLCYSGSQQQDLSCLSGVHLVTCGSPLLSHTMLPCRRKGCRLPMATAQEMKKKGSF